MESKEPYLEKGDTLTSATTYQVYEILSFERYEADDECWSMRVRLNRNYYINAIRAGKNIPNTITIMKENEFEEYRLGHDTDSTRSRHETRLATFKAEEDRAKVILLRNKYINQI